jgi:hypothetical protein
VLVLIALDFRFDLPLYSAERDHHLLLLLDFVFLNSHCHGLEAEVGLHLADLLCLGLLAGFLLLR